MYFLEKAFQETLKGLMRQSGAVLAAGMPGRPPKLQREGICL